MDLLRPLPQDQDTKQNILHAASSVMTGIAIAGMTSKLPWAACGTLATLTAIGFYTTQSTLCSATRNTNTDLRNTLAPLAAIGMLVSLGLNTLGVMAASITMAAFSCALVWGTLKRHILPSRKQLAPAVCGATLLSIISVVYVSTERDIMTWDPAIAWQASQAIASDLQQKAVVQFIVRFALSLSDDYSVISRLPVALVLAMGDPYSRMLYALGTTLTGTLVAALVLVKIYTDLVRPSNFTVKWRTFFVLFLILSVPLLTGISLYGLTDVMGTALGAMALFCAIRLSKLIGNGAARLAIGRRAIVTAALWFGFLVAVMFFYRRWYVFLAVGLTAAAFVEIALSYLSQPARRAAILRGFLSASLAALSIGIVLIQPFFAMASLKGLPHLATMYEMYDGPVSTSLSLASHVFGWPLLALSGLGLGVLAWRSKEGHQVVRMLCITGIAALFAFHQVQMFNAHHLLIFVPILAIASLSALSFIMERSLLLGGMVVLSVIIPKQVSDFPVSRDALQVHTFYSRQRSDFEGLQGFERWLAATDTPKRGICMLAADVTMNIATAKFLWRISEMDAAAWDKQIAPRLAAMPDVDSRDGPPSRSLQTCEYAVALQGSSFSEHQNTIGIPAAEILSGIGIGAAFQDTGIAFPMREATVLKIFKRVGPTSKEDIDALRERFYRSKGARADEFRGRFESRSQ